MNDISQIEKRPGIGSARRSWQMVCSCEIRTRHDRHRAQGLIVGSGVIEAGWKTITGKRLKEPGICLGPSAAPAP